MEAWKKRMEKEVNERRRKTGHEGKNKLRKVDSQK